MKLNLTTVQQIFPHLEHPGLLDEIVKYAILKEFKEGDILVGQGDEVALIPVVVDGTVKVIKEDASDREILLYYIESGESCVLSLASLVSFERSKVTAVVERPVVALLLPGKLVFSWMSAYTEWMQFVFSLFEKRLSEVMGLVEAIAFQKADERLWQHLVKKSATQEGDTIAITHQELALEVGSVREVISRLLKQLEREGKVELYRGRVKVILP